MTRVDGPRPAVVPLLPTAGVLRLARGGVVGTSAVTLSLVAHLLTGGAVPDAVRLAVLTLVATATCVALSGQRWRTPALLAVLLGAQAVFHVAFGGMAHPGMTHPGMAGMGGTDAGTAMLAAHVCAAVVVALLLRKGEDTCWRLVDLVTAPWRVADLEPVMLPPDTGAEATPATAEGPRSPAWLAAVAPRRGPPRLLAR
ncbi:MAG: hypothetical protein ACXVXC_13450 [Nocardioidaceae bacterium]